MFWAGIELFFGFIAGMLILTVVAALIAFCYHGTNAVMARADLALKRFSAIVLPRRP
jgi:hypothetical protein